MKQFLIRLLLLNTTGAILMGIYQFINHRSDTVHRMIEMPEWVPFWPLMTIPYLLMLILPWTGALMLKENQHFYQYLVAVSLSFLVIASIWYFYPTEMTRPATPEGSIYEIHRILITYDEPVCIVPCGHVMSPIIIIFLLARERAKRLTFLLPLLGIGFISVATTWQHRPIDIVTGSIITIATILLTQKIFRVKNHSAAV